MSDLTAYEKERLERIAKNQALLSSLQLGLPDESKPKRPAGKPKPKPKPRSSAASDVTDGDSPVTRRMTRSNAVRTAALESKDPVAAKRKREEDERQETEAELAKKAAKHEDREIETWNPTGRFQIPDALVILKQSLENVATSGVWPRSLHPSIKVPPSPRKPKTTPKKRGRKAKKEESDTGEEDEDEDEELDDEDYKADIGVEQLKETFENMSLKAVKRITPDRIYSAAIHPTREKDLVFIGDRQGWLGIWDASADAEEEVKEEDEDEEDTVDRNAFVQRVYNDHGTISCLRLDPIRAHTIYTSSYDCTIRSLNFESGVWREEVDIDLQAANEDGEGEALISGFELTHNGHEAWISDNAGGVTHADFREPKTAARRWKVAESKVGCISLNPANEHYFVTAHLNRDVRLWDTRKLAKVEKATASDHRAVFDEAALSVFTNGLACSSAYFDPSGRHVLSTSYDSTLRIWDVTPHKASNMVLNKPRTTVTHDNKTGRYVTPFKAVWSSNPRASPFFTVGNMTRALDIFTADGKKIAKLDQGVSTIPSVTCTHPSKPSIIGGAAGGKVYYWAADDWA